MNFQQMLIAAIESAEIPLRFERRQSVAQPVAEMLRTWISRPHPTR